jgi:hypothetical protein
MGIKQFNGSYLIHEDRILFRFNTDEAAEYRLWLTRRITLFILGATAHLIEKQLEKNHSPEAAKAIAQFDQANLEEQLNKPKDDGASSGTGATEVYQGGSQYPLGSDPLLVMDVQCQLSKEKNVDALSVDFALPGGANLNLKLDGKMLQALCVLLQHLAVNAQWQTTVQVQVSEQEIELLEANTTKIPLH